MRWRRTIKKRELSIGADDLLVLMSFVLVKSQISNVISELAFTEDFMSESTKLSMPGYFLATMQAAVELIAGLDPKTYLGKISN